MIVLVQWLRPNYWVFLPAGQVNLHPRNRDTVWHSELVFYFFFSCPPYYPLLYKTAYPDFGVGGLLLVPLLFAVLLGLSVKVPRWTCNQESAKDIHCPRFWTQWTEKWENKDRTVSGILPWGPQSPLVVSRITGLQRHSHPNLRNLRIYYFTWQRDFAVVIKGTDFEKGN